MTGLSVLRQVYALMERPERLVGASDGNESALLALNQIYSDLWSRERAEAFEPLTHLREPVCLSWRSLPALTYGTAALLCLNSGEERPYDRFLELYLRALPRKQGQPYRRSATFFGEAAE